jgi:pimeloyl-ACP methyl ester carboxylesterase
MRTTQPDLATTSSHPERVSSELTSTPVETFVAAQRRALHRYGVDAESRFISVPAIDGRAHVLTAGEGPPLMMVIGGTVPAVMWAPLMAQLTGYTLHAVDLPGFGLTDAVAYHPATMRSTVVDFLAQLLDGLDLGRTRFVTSSQGSLWTTWLSFDQPDRVAADVQIGCPAHILGTTAPLPMRLMSVPPIGRLMVRLQTPTTASVERIGRAVGEDLASLPELRDALLACQRLPTFAPSLLGLMNAVMRFGRTRDQIALTAEQLARIDHPVQLLWGKEDPFGSPAVARQAAAIIPDAELHILRGGHAPWFDHADQVAQHAGRFLGDHPH